MILFFSYLCQTYLLIRYDFRSTLLRNAKLVIWEKAGRQEWSFVRERHKFCLSALGIPVPAFHKYRMSVFRFFCIRTYVFDISAE